MALVIPRNEQKDLTAFGGQKGLNGKMGTEEEEKLASDHIMEILLCLGLERWLS